MLILTMHQLLQIAPQGGVAVEAAARGLLKATRALRSTATRSDLGAGEWFPIISGHNSLYDLPCIDGEYYREGCVNMLR